MRIWAVVLFVAIACGDDDGAPDGGEPDGGACTETSECDDGVFCNGAESCVSGGCVSGTAPCAGTCDEENDRCDTCIDADGDGVPSAACGGADCDDDDPGRFPGATEVCDADDVDEDCDLDTYGRRDIDGDDVTDTACCNGDNCGEDCDDNRAGVSPTATETCNGLDDDCDGEVDEDVGSLFTIDADGDGFGAIDGETIVACFQPDGYAETTGDCDDTEPSVNPGNPELCDPEMVDENCDGLMNPPEDCSCSAGDPPRACSYPPGSVCASGTEMCIGGMWGSCSIMPEAIDVCDGRDEDCNGVADDPFMCARDSVRSCLTECGTEGTQTCDGECRWGACSATEVCNGCDDDADGIADDGFECALGGPPTDCTNSCGNAGTAACTTGCMLNACVTTELCDYCDDDGDGTSDDELLDATTIDITTTPMGPDTCSELRINDESQDDVFCSGGQMQFIDFGGTDQHEIAAWLADPLPVGYGPVVVDVDLFVAMQATNEPGWGMGFVLGATNPRSSQLAGDASFAGIPTNYDGIAFQHQWKRDDMFSGDLDGVQVYAIGRGSATELAASPVPPAAVIRIDAGPSSGNKRLIIRITYDRGNTVTGRPRSVSMHACEYSSGDPGNPPCNPLTEILSHSGPEVPDIAPGGDLYFGVTHGARGGLGRNTDTQAKVRWWHRQPFVSQDACLP